MESVLVWAKMFPCVWEVEPFCEGNFDMITKFNLSLAFIVGICALLSQLSFGMMEVIDWSIFYRKFYSQYNHYVENRKETRVIREYLQEGLYRQAEEAISGTERDSVLKNPVFLAELISRYMVGSKEHPSSECESFIDFLLKDPKVIYFIKCEPKSLLSRDIFKERIIDYKSPIDQAARLNRIDLMRRFIALDNGKTVSKSHALYEASENMHAEMVQFLCNETAIAYNDPKQLQDAIDETKERAETHEGTSEGEQYHAIAKMLSERQESLKWPLRASRAIRLAGGGLCAYGLYRFYKSCAKI